MSTLAILQSRMGSSRLPGKVLLNVAGKTIMDHLLDRLSPSSEVDRFVVATTTQPEDDALEAWCEARGVTCFRGSDWDVLDRFWGAANSFDDTPDTIVRICCDNPLHTYKVLDEVVANYRKAGTDYFSNSNQEPDFLEDGFDVEVFSYDSLRKAQDEATLLSEREHVCPYIKKHFTCAWKKTDPEYMFKLSVDTLADLQAVERIFEVLKEDVDFGIHEVTQLLKEQPEILKINQSSNINSGYAKSLKEDRKIK